ncbi:MAG: MBL fold metallo-hydrolase [Bdellovibrionota bacterium]
MKLIFWGTRGSSPVIGHLHEGFNSHHSPCVEFVCANDSVIVDAGTALGDAIRSKYKSGKREFSICLSHFHWDHILGLISIYDLFYTGIKLKIYSAEERSQEYISTLYFGAYCPIDPSIVSRSLEFVHVKKTAKISGFDISFSEVPHAGKTFAIEVVRDGRRAIYMSDVNLTELKNSPFLESPDLLICDSFHLKKDHETRRDWGHSSGEQAAQFATAIKARTLALFHYDPNYTESEISAVLAEATSASPELKIIAPQDNESVDI